MGKLAISFPILHSRCTLVKTKEYLGLYSAACLTCKSLVEYGTVKNKDCHYTQGNAQCPAAEVKIVFIGEAQDYALRVLKARDKRMAKTEARLMQHVGKQSAAFRSKFYEYLENGIPTD
jgi:hypothetical protein